MPRLLVSVRSAAEAETALAGGAAVIDVKEPAYGPLGKASDRVIREVAKTVAGRTRMSAAMGELLASWSLNPPAAGLSWGKYGLSGYALRDPNLWPKALPAAEVFVRANNPDCRLVVVAYADSGRAH